jgi:electron transport complex protein RnfB
MSQLYGLLLIVAVVLIAALLLQWARSRLTGDSSQLVDAVDGLLPQTQCAQCGYPGCRPYAEAVVQGAALDLCPPGGAPVQAALADLLGRPSGMPLPTPQPLRAVIDESRCIGCFLCVEACPVDAIVGAPQWLHTVIEDRCTGCELCLPPCPVDCIELKVIDHAATAAPLRDTDPEEKACIRCGACQTICPEGLQPDLLWWTSRTQQPADAASGGLRDCIECGLCNQVCPSEIDLLNVFVDARSRLAASDQMAAEAARARVLYNERETRLQQQAQRSRERREARLKTGSRQW